MRDEERIKAYYRFGTIDCHSELFSKRKSGKKTLADRVLRPLKLATLVWIEVLKNVSSVKK